MAHVIRPAPAFSVPNMQVHPRVALRQAVSRSNDVGAPSPCVAELGRPQFARVSAASAAVAGGLGAVANRKGRRRHVATGRRARGGEAANNSSAQTQDFYGVLGVDRGATDKDIKTAFRRLAKKWHPDVNKEPGAQAQFERITEAYDVLSDAEKRARYDQFGNVNLGGMGAGPDLSSFNLQDLEAIFNSFGATLERNVSVDGSGEMPLQGGDIQIETEIPFLVACFGGDWTVQVTRDAVCETCSGSGVKKDCKEARCRECNGLGKIVQEVNFPWGTSQTQQACPSCNGTTIEPSVACASCRGDGVLPQLQKVSVKVPAGCNDGNRLRVRGKGHAGHRGLPPGDLYISVKLQPHAEFERVGSDIYTESIISAYDAMLGTTITVKTIDGSREVRVPAGVQPSTFLRMKGKGAPKLGQPGERGCHYVRVTVEVPHSVNEEDRKLLEELRAEHSDQKI